MKIENNMGAHCKTTWDKEWVNLALFVVKLHIRCGSNTMLIGTNHLDGQPAVSHPLEKTGEIRTEEI